jgi:hypothetical protein
MLCRLDVRKGLQPVRAWRSASAWCELHTRRPPVAYDRCRFQLGRVVIEIWYDLPNNSDIV